MQKLTPPMVEFAKLNRRYVDFLSFSGYAQGVKTTETATTKNQKRCGLSQPALSLLS